MFKRSQQQVSDSSKHWYQDKFQSVLTQRNVLALVAVISLVTAAMAVLAVMRLAPLKTVEPYLLQIDEKTGITQRVNPITQEQYMANQAVDRYFTATYLRTRESYNANIYYFNMNLVRLMSSREVFFNYRSLVDPEYEAGYVKRLGPYGQRDVKIRSLYYLPTVADPTGKVGSPRTRIIQAKITTTESSPNVADTVSYWIVTITFEYAQLDLTEEEQWLNPLGYTVTSYQIQRELN